MTKLVLPLHISDSSTLNAPTDRFFLSVPNVFIGPTVVLLYFLSIQKFIVVQTLLMFIIGFAGLLGYPQTAQALTFRLYYPVLFVQLQRQFWGITPSAISPGTVTFCWPGLSP